MFYWNISVDKTINQLFTMEFILACQKEFSMKVRDKEYIYTSRWYNGLA